MDQALSKASFGIKLLLLLFLLAGNVYSQTTTNDSGYPVINNYDRSDYFGSDQFWDIIQDDRGIMYFGNSNYGIQQFDGINWNIISPPNSTQAYHLAKNKEGTIFSGHRSDFGYLKPDSLHQLQFQSLLPYVPDSLQNFNIVQAVETLQNKAYFCTDHTLFQWDNKQLKTWPGLDVAGCFTSDNSFYVNSYQRGLLKLENESLQLIIPELQQKTVLKAFETARGVLFITSESGLFLKKDQQVQKLERFDLLEDQNFILKDAVFLPNGKLVFGTSKGILEYNLDGQLLRHITMKEGLSDNGVSRLYVDRIGRLWATTNKGITTIEYSNPIRILFDAEQYQNRPQKVFQHQQDLYLALDDGLMKREEGEWEMILPNYLVQDFALIEQSMLVGTTNGLYVYQRNQFTKINDKSVFRITRSNRYEGLAYVFYPDEGIGVVRQTSDGNFLSYPLKEYSETIYTVVEDEQGELWLGTGNNGIYRNQISGNDNRLKVEETFHYTEEDGFPASSFNYTTKIDGKIGFITENGLYRFNEDEQKIIPDARFERIYDRSEPRSWPVTEDQYGHLWMDFGSDEIVEGIPQEDGSYAFISKPYARMNPFGDIRQIISTDSSTTLFLTHNYLTEFQKNIAGPAKESFNTFISSVALEDSLLWAGTSAGSNRLNKQIHYTTDAIRFNWSAASYYPSEHTSFRYRLKGLNDEWSEWIKESYRDFTNLPEGEYTLEVQASNMYKTVGKMASLQFEVLPPWYRTAYAYLLYLLLGVAGIFGLIRLRERKIEQRQRELEAQIDQRTRELQKEKSQLEKANQTIQEQSAQLKRMDEIKNQFFANISHELRTPLTLIRGPIRQILQGNGSQSSDYGQKLAIVDQNAERLEDMVEQILELTRLQTGKQELKLQSVDIAEFLERMVFSFESLAMEKQIELELEYSEPLPELYVDKKKIDHILTNLLSNALKFTDSHGKVTVTAEKVEDSENGIKITVEDTGCGIKSEHLDHVFDRFYNVEIEKEDYREGLGIGLALTQQLVELHDGAVSVESERGVGSIFTVFLPANKHQAPEIVEKQIVPTTGQPSEYSNELPDTDEESVEIENATVLVVDDNEAMRKYIGDILGDLFNIQLTEDGKKALDRIRATKYDLIVADVMMPNMDGFTLAEQCMKDDDLQDIPFMFVTARASEKERLRGLRIGVNDYIVKPFLPEELIVRAQNLVKAHLRRKHWIKVELSGEEQIGRDDAIVDEIQQYIIQHIDNSGLKVEQLALELNISTRQLYRKLKSLTGFTPAQFIKEVRLQHARQLLEEQADIRVSEAAAAVGFSTSGYFSRQFKERFGSSPSKYS